VPVTDSDALPTAHRTPGTPALAVPDPLPALQQEFPAFRIWRETMRDRVRYIARSPHLGLNPHTVVTADPSELRAALLPSRSAAHAAGQYRP
jgi:hypothetical protein